MTTPSPEILQVGAIRHTSLQQASYFVGLMIQNILYGVELLLYFKTIHILLLHKGARKKSNIFYALFSTMMLFLISIWITTGAIFAANMWLVNLDYPGGPDAYWGGHITDWYNDLGMTAVIILQLMTDALMIYRCWIIWNSYRVIIVPFILWLGTLVLGFWVNSIICSPGGDLFIGVAAKLGLAYYTITMFLNTILTCMICYHIMRHARKVREYIGHEYASLYFTAITIIVESVFPYTISGIALLVVLGMGSLTTVAFISVYFMMMCISPQILILRVISGRALHKDTFRQSVSTVEFSPGTLTGSQPFDGNVNLGTLSKVYLPNGPEKA